jgi:hypothetical protein
MSDRRIAEVDFDEPSVCVGDYRDVVYVNWAQEDPALPGGWYFSAVVDSDSGSFVEPIATDDGPYNSELDVAMAAIGAGMDWCCNNEVKTDSFAEYLPGGLRREYAIASKTCPECGASIRKCEADDDCGGLHCTNENCAWCGRVEGLA